MKKRVLALIMAVLMLASLLPTAAMADGEPAADENKAELVEKLEEPKEENLEEPKEEPQEEPKEEELLEAPMLLGAEPDNTDYFTITGDNGSNFTVKLKGNIGTFQYRTMGDSGWGDWTGYTLGTAITAKAVQFQGTGTTAALAQSTTVYDQFSFGNDDKVSLSGDIMTLLAPEYRTDTITSNRCFAYLFKDCAAITSAAELKLSATKLAWGCYYFMFCCCKALTEAPKLPATTLAKECYYYMFVDCAALERPADMSKVTQLAKDCCKCMYIRSGVDVKSNSQPGYSAKWIVPNATLPEGVTSWGDGMLRIDGTAVAPTLGTTYYMKDAPVAKIGDTEYATVQEAINAATEGQTVVMIANSRERVAIGSKTPVDKVTLDLNGHTLIGLGEDNVIMVNKSSADLTIKDSNPNQAHYYTYSSSSVWKLNDNADEEAKNKAIALDAVDSKTKDGTLVLISGGAITGGNRSGKGGGIYAATNAKLTLNGINVVGNIADSGNSGGGVYGNTDSTITCTNCNIVGNIAIGTTSDESTSGGTGGGIYTKGALEITGSKIEYNQASFDGGALYAYGTGATAENSQFVGNNSARHGGAVYIAKGKTFGADKCTFSNNKATGVNGYGGAVYINGETGNVSKATITDCTFENNYAFVSGGGIYNNYGTATITGGSYKNNSAQYAGVIFNDNGNATITGGSYKNNSVTRAGGVIYNDGATLNITGGTFESNTATSDENDTTGGFLHSRSANSSGSSVTITGTTIKSNQAKNGGAIYNVRYNSSSSYTSTITITNCEITGNTASANGGGVYNVCNLIIGGTAKIYGNTKGTGESAEDNNLYLTAGKTVTLGTGTGAGQNGVAVPVTTDTDKMIIGVTLESGTGAVTASNGAVDYSSCFTSDDDKYEAVNDTTDADAQFVKLQKPIHVHDKGKDTEMVFDQVLTADGSAIVYDENNVANVFLTENVVLTTDITVEQNMTLNLCLNGYALKGTGKDFNNAIEVKGTFNLYDCNSTGQSHKFTVPSGTDKAGTWTWDEENGTEEITGGFITDSYMCITVRDYPGVFNMYSGTIIGCGKEKQNAVFVDGEFNMYGGAVTGNGAGGVYDTGTVNMYGGDITYNSTVYGGGIEVCQNASLTVTGGTISHNMASDGGGICNRPNCTATVSGAEISYNVSEKNGGGICNEGSMTLTDCNITNNSAANFGGGIYSEDSLTLTDCNITNNSAANFGGGIYSSGNLTLTDCNITNNSATKFGGGIWTTSNIESGKYTSGEKIQLGGCTIKNNTAGEGGGGVLYAKTETIPGCFAAGTAITMADGSVRNIEDIRDGDLVRTFDHETGTVSSEVVCFTYESDRLDSPFILRFASGAELPIVGCHSLLEKSSGKYIDVSESSAGSCIGLYFYNADAAGWDKLVGVSKDVGKCRFYSIYTAHHINCVANGMLTAPDDAAFLLNIFDLDASLKIDQAEKNADIAAYGLTSYEEVTALVDSTAFDLYNIRYLNVAIGKGITTLDKVVSIYREGTEYYSSKNSMRAPLAPKLKSFKANEYESGMLNLSSNVVITDNTSGAENSKIKDNLRLSSYATDGCVAIGEGATGIVVGVSAEFNEGKVQTGIFTTECAATDISFFSADKNNQKILLNDDGNKLELANFELSAVAGNTFSVTLENDSMTDTQAKAIAAAQMPNDQLTTVTVIAYAKDKDFATNGKYLTIKADSTNPWAEGDAMTLSELKAAVTAETDSKDVFVIGTVTNHTHAWTYAQGGTGKANTLLAYCTADNCDGTAVSETTAQTLTISAPALTTYGGTENEKATLSGTALGGLTVSDSNVTYYAKGADGNYGTTALDAAPKAAGSYKAVLTVNDGTKDLTAYVEYSIAKAQVDVPEAVTGLTYDGNQKTGVADAAEDAKYTVSDNKQTNAGSYKAKAELKDKDNYEWKNKSTSADQEIAWSIAKAASSVTAAPTASAITYGQKLSDSTLTGGTGSVDGSFTWKVGTTAPAVSDSDTTEYAVVFTPTDTANYNNAECNVKLTVNKATPTYTAPTGLTATEGQTLADIKLPDGFEWVDDKTTSVGEIGEHTFYANYNPDENNYNTQENIEITVTVKAAGPVCVGDKVVKFNELMPGHYTMFINDVNTGVYDFDMVVGGYTIRNVNTDEYVCFDNGKIVMKKTDNPTAWAKDDAAFHYTVIETTRYWLFGWRTKTAITEYYLNADASGKLTASKLPGITHFAFHIEKDHHSYVYTFNGNGTHTCTCAVCGYSRVEDCTYGDGEHCIYCGSFDITKAGVKSVEVSVDKTEVGGGLKFVGWKLTYVKPYTTYTAHIYAYAEGTTVSKVEYSTDGANYADGSVYTSASAINALYIRVTDANGAVTYWLYNGSSTSRMS